MRIRIESLVNPFVPALMQVWTSGVSGAGTDANVFIQLFGEEGETGRIALDNPGR